MEQFACPRYGRRVPARRAHAAAGAFVALVASRPAAGLPTERASRGRTDEARVVADLFGLPSGPAPIDVRVGAWAEYLVRSRGANGRMRISVLEAEPEAVLIEAAMFGDAGLPFVARLRFHTEASGGALRCLTRLESLAVHLLGLAPLDLPVAGRPVRDACSAGARPERRANVTVAAGTFAAAESRLGRERVWIARDVPLWGLVRAQGRGCRAELLAFGWSGARSFVAAQGTGSDNTNE
jgi:hypothetical protein